MKPFYRNRVTWFIAILLFHGSAVACEPTAIFSFSKALYTGQILQAQNLLAQVRVQHGEPMALFLSEVARWKQGYEQQERLMQSQALRAIDQLLNTLKASNQHDSNAKNALLIGNIAIHAARMRLVMGNMFSAAKLAKLSHEMISKVLKIQPNNADAMLAAGLYQIYTDQDNQGGFITKRFGFDGDKSRGRALIEKALQNSPDYAFEAARTLLMEVGGSRQQVCRYPSLIEIGNNDYSFKVYQLFIHQALYCGRASLAKKAINLATLQASKKTQKEWLFSANLYTLAQLGLVEQLERIHQDIPETEILQKSELQFSLAKALDVKHESSKARPWYAQVLASNLGPTYKRLSASYIKTPYAPPSLQRAHGVEFACWVVHLDPDN